MGKNKYNLSKEGVERVLKALQDMSEASLPDGDTTGLRSAEITTSYMKTMMRINSLEEVVKNRGSLNRKYIGLVDMYGFNDIYDMYLYAMSCDLFPEGLSKSRDRSKLVPVKRKIVRNGKESEVTVYINPNKEDKDKDDSTASGEGQGGGRGGGGQHARDLSRHKTSKKDKGYKEKTKTLQEAVKSMPRGGKFKVGSEFYLEIRGDEGSLAGVIGYSEDNGYLVMDFYKSNGTVSGVATVGFFELMVTAKEENKGVKAADDVQARPVFMQSGMEQRNDGNWYIEADALQELLKI